MSKNYMPDVAKMLGVELGERFTLDDGTNTEYAITQKGISIFGNDKKCNTDFVLGCLLRGSYEIVKLPWKPKDGDDYYFVYPDGSIYCCHFCYKGPVDLAMLYMGNCFRTKADAEAHKDEIMAKFREVMEWWRD